VKYETKWNKLMKRLVNWKVKSRKLRYWLFYLSPPPSPKFPKFETDLTRPKFCRRLLKNSKAKFVPFHLVQDQNLHKYRSCLILYCVLAISYLHFLNIINGCGLNPPLVSKLTIVVGGKVNYFLRTPTVLANMKKISVIVKWRKNLTVVVEVCWILFIDFLKFWWISYIFGK
jgi:hypothetical protein